MPVAFFTYNGSYQSGVQNLSPFEGALVRTTSAISGFQIPVNTIIGFAGGRIREGKTAPESYFNNDSDWRLKLNLASDGFKFGLSGIGMNPDADESTDRYNIWTPPHFLDYLEANFDVPDADGPITQSIVPPNSSFTWDLEINTSLKKTTFITWNKELIHDATGHLFLEDLRTGRVVNMKTNSSLEISDPDETKLQVYYAQVIPKELKAKMVILGNNYPNPFTDNTTIPFDIVGDRDTYQTILSVYNSQGQLVTTLVEEELTVGHYELNWSGSDQAGKPLPNGLYFYQLKFGNKVSPMKKIVKQY